VVKLLLRLGKQKQTQKGGDDGTFLDGLPPYSGFKTVVAYEVNK